MTDVLYIRTRTAMFRKIREIEKDKRVISYTLDRRWTY